jgi:putative oxidoreductase
MDLALLVLRVVVGLLFAGHGAQKLWGKFGGHGLEGTGGFFESIGMRPGRLNAQVAGTCEFLGGLLLAFGLLSPLGAVLVISVMTVAILSVHLKNGPWVTENGYEYNLVLIAAAFITAAGPGTASLDDAFGFDAYHGAEWAIAALFIGVAGGATAYFTARRGLLARATGEEPRFTREPATQDAEATETQPTTRSTSS